MFSQNVEATGALVTTDLVSQRAHAVCRSLPLLLVLVGVGRFVLAYGAVVTTNSFHPGLLEQLKKAGD